MDNWVSPIGRTAREAAADRERNDPEYARIKRERARKKDADAVRITRWKTVNLIGRALVAAGATLAISGWKRPGIALFAIGGLLSVLALWRWRRLL